ncbi:MAG TPA: ABC-type transport auxiliary lipoprotein family protein [Noviherbaspirillum sp.]|nr:ABC-type transport auxiliary lipoprotein family protein [Noviherbaspirillum sp.]
MKKILPVIVAMLLAAGCAGNQSSPTTVYDLGPLDTRQATAIPGLPPVAIAEIQGPGWLDSTLIFYRLNYSNTQQPKPYAHARWTMPPAQLLLQRLKVRITQAGGVAVAASHGATNVPVLRVEADEFSQNFDAPDSSTAQVGLRASVYKGRTLVAHKGFLRQVPAPSADAEGGVKALAAASDAAITDLMMWLGTLDLK